MIHYYIDSIYENFLRLLVEDGGVESEIHLSESELWRRFPFLKLQTQSLFEGMAWSLDCENKVPEGGGITFHNRDHFSATTSERMHELKLLQDELFGEEKS